jgi:HAD superfamily hydrolase (TIGR01509 family)
MSTNARLPEAIIFDMDGVLVDSNPFHLRKWIDLFRAHGVAFDEAELPKIVLGPPNEVTFRRFLGERLSPEEMAALGEELEENFRRAIGPHTQSFPGVQPFIESCHAEGIPMAVASAAISKNVEFLIAALGLRPYFREMLTGDEVTHPKPDPEVYLKTAAKLGVAPAGCAVFEDSFVGIEAAKRAGMKCVAIASTFPAQDLRRETRADLILPSFAAVSLPTVHALFNGAGHPPVTTPVRQGTDGPS